MEYAHPGAVAGAEVHSLNGVGEPVEEVERLRVVRVQTELLG